MVTNNLILKNNYAIIEIKSKTYHHFMKLDCEDVEKVGKVRVSKEGYAYQAGQHGKSVASAVLNYTTNTKIYIDHINGDTLDNRKINLRICTPSENAKNRHSFSRNNTGTVGIQYRVNSKYEYYRVSLTDKSGKRFTKQFNINKLGKDRAFLEAEKCLKAKKLEFGYII